MQALNYDADKTYAWTLQDVQQHRKPFQACLTAYQHTAPTCEQVPSWAARGAVVWLRREHCLRMARMPVEMRKRPSKRKRKRSASLTLS